MNFLSKNFKKISTQLLIMEIDFCPVDQMAWVRADNQHRAIAEEIILKELIYVLMLLVNNLADN